MEFQDYYQLLGVARDADADAVKKAYRALALKWHPDRHSGEDRDAAEEKFKRINEAYEVLSDPEKRSKYDKFGKDWEHGQDFRPPPGSQGMSSQQYEAAFGKAGFSEFFETLFGEQFARGFSQGPTGRPRPPRRGNNIRAELALGVSEALLGGKRRFNLPSTVACDRCDGSGFIGDHVCPGCAGVGGVRTTKTIDLAIPSDISDGKTVRLRGLGENGPAGAGDFLITFRLVSDETYRVERDDVYADVPIAPWEALAGTKADVVTPAGTVRLSIPAKFKAGKRMRLRGKGLTRDNGSRGDFYAVIRLALPEGMTAEQEKLLVEVGENSPGVVRGGARTAETVET